MCFFQACMPSSGAGTTVYLNTSMNMSCTMSINRCQLTTNEVNGMHKACRCAMCLLRMQEPCEGRHRSAAAGGEHHAGLPAAEPPHGPHERAAVLRRRWHHDLCAP